MNNFQYKHTTDKKILKEWMNKLLTQLVHPIDEYVEEQILNGKTSLIQHDNESIGFFVVHGNTLIKLFIEEDTYTNSPAILQDIIKKFAITDIQLGTYESRLLAIALPLATKIKTIGLLFKEKECGKKYLSSGPNQKLSWHLAAQTETQQILQISNDFFEAAELSQRINDKEVYLLSNQEDILGIGLATKSYFQPGIINLGVFTNSNYRKQGIGNKIIALLKEEAHQQNHIPYCGCETDNVASKATLEKAGFIAVEKLLLLHIQSP